MGAKICESGFDLVYWEGMGQVMQRFPHMYCVWTTKQMCGVCGCNEHLSCFDLSVENVCPAFGCGQRGEPVEHVVVCNDPGQMEIFPCPVNEMILWMDENKTDPEIAELTEAHLEACGYRVMSDLVNTNAPTSYSLLAHHQDCLGWQHFTEGQFVLLFIQVQRGHLSTSDFWKPAESLVGGLMEQLFAKHTGNGPIAMLKFAFATLVDGQLPSSNR